MPSGILFFEKNKIDLDLGTKVTITVTDAVASDTGQSYVDYMRNRDNSSGWSTTESTDAANTTLVVAFGETHTISEVLAIGQNWKSYTIKYWNGSAWADFSTPIAETVNAEADKHHSFTPVDTDQLQIIITGTMTADDDKRCAQLIVTERIGRLNTQPSIEAIEIGKNRRTLRTLSGKAKVQRGVGAVSFTLRQNSCVNDADLLLVESLYEYHAGFLVWLCGGDTTQFRTQRIGYRKKDLFLVSVASEYRPTWEGGFYQHGTPIDLQLVEVI
jgi:hypothetical protein